MRINRLINICIWPLILGGLFACNSEPTICERFHANGKLQYRVPCDGGIYNGLYEEYNRSGDLWVTRMYVNGVVEDTVRYYYSRTGELLKEVPMKADQKEGRAREYEKDGTLKREQDFVAGKRNGGDREYHSNGKVVARLTTYKDNQKNGPFIRKGSDGTVLTQGAYVEDIPFGDWTHFYASGEPLAQFTYKNGVRKGQFFIVRKDGTPFVSGFYNGGMIDGPVRYYDKLGKHFFSEIWSVNTNLDHDFTTGLEKEYKGDNAGFYHPADRTYILMSRDSVIVTQTL